MSTKISLTIPHARPPSGRFRCDIGLAQPVAVVMVLDSGCEKRGKARALAARTWGDMQQATAVRAMAVAVIVYPNDTRARFGPFGQVDR
jgi:hypothetical protein